MTPKKIILILITLAILALSNLYSYYDSPEFSDNTEQLNESTVSPEPPFDWLYDGLSTTTVIKKEATVTVDVKPQTPPPDVSVSNKKNEIVTRINNALAGSPMSGYGDTFYEYAVQNELDWRLSLAIAKVESGFGRFIPGGNSFNAWGMTCGCSPTYNTNCVQGFDIFPNWGTGILAHNDYIRRLWGANASPETMTGYATSTTWKSKVRSAMNFF